MLPLRIAPRRCLPQSRIASQLRGIPSRRNGTLAPQSASIANEAEPPESDPVEPRSLGDLKVRQLQRLARACGIMQSGTKDVLVQRIADVVESSRSTKRLREDDRILSIDMGIKNFAFCLMTPKGDAILKRSKKGRFKPNKLEAALENTTKEAQKVTKEAVLEARRKSSSATPITTIPFSAELLNWRTLDLSPEGGKEFSKDWLAGMAISVVQGSLLSLRPTHILIEQQRFRSNGQPNVLEWTLRVNSFEAVLHAVLATMRLYDVWDCSKAPAESVDPSRTAPFFFADEEGKGTRIDAKQLKKMKIDLMGSWLLIDHKTPGAAPRVTPVGAQAQEVTNTFLKKWQAQAKQSTSTPNATVVRKLDDLADCVVQGMAWMQWQQNKVKLAEVGPFKFLEMLQDE